MKYNICESQTAHEMVICHKHTICQTEIPALLDSWVTNTPTLTTFVTTKKLLVLIFSQKYNSSTEDRSSFFCLLKNSVLVGYDKLLFHK